VLIIDLLSSDHRSTSLHLPHHQLQAFNFPESKKRGLIIFAEGQCSWENRGDWPVLNAVDEATVFAVLVDNVALSALLLLVRNSWTW
jgi:hypothetical protein